MNLPHYRSWVVNVDDHDPINVIERTTAGAVICAVVLVIPRADRRGWPDTSQHHTAYVFATGVPITEIAVWFDSDGCPRTYTEGER